MNILPFQAPLFYRGGGIVINYDTVKMSTPQIQNDSLRAHMNVD